MPSVRLDPFPERGFDSIVFTVLMLNLIDIFYPLAIDKSSHDAPVVASNVYTIG